MFEHLEKPSYPQLIAQRIRSLILERELEPGDRLPSERAMREQFGVSRASVREGIRLLDALGWVEIRTGDGTYISKDLNRSVLQAFSWAVILTKSVAADLIEARLVVEPHLAALAAKRATESDLQKMRTTIERMKTHLGNSAVGAEADLDFHLAVAQAAGNSLLREVLLGLQQIMRAHLDEFYTSVQQQKQAIDDHLTVLDAIQRGDSAAAAQAMKDSIAESPDLFDGI